MHYILNCQLFNSLSTSTSHKQEQYVNYYYFHLFHNQKLKRNIMPIIKVLIITIVLMLIAMLALSVRLIFTKKGEFRGGSCRNHPDELKEQGIGCGCGSGTCETVQ